MNSEYIIDLQGFRHDHYSIIRELTIVDIDSHNVVHSLAKPPFDKAILSSAEQKNVCWLERNHHKIQWGDGTCEYSEVFAGLRRAIRDAHTFYVKGSEKALFIRNVTGKFTLDLDLLGCPRANMLPSPTTDT